MPEAADDNTGMLKESMPMLDEQGSVDGPVKAQLGASSKASMSTVDAQGELKQEASQESSGAPLPPPQPPPLSPMPPPPPPPPPPPSRAQSAASTSLPAPRDLGMSTTNAKPQYASAEEEEAALGFISLKLAGPKVNSRRGLGEFLAMHGRGVPSGGGSGATDMPVRDTVAAEQGGGPAAVKAGEASINREVGAAGPEATADETAFTIGAGGRRMGGARSSSERSNGSERGAEQLSELKAARAAAKSALEKLARGEQLDAADQAAVQALAEVAQSVEIEGCYYYTPSSADALARGHVEEMKMQALMERAKSESEAGATGDVMSAEELDRMLAHQAAIVRMRKMQATLRADPPARPLLSPKRRNSAPMIRKGGVVVVERRPSMGSAAVTPPSVVEVTKAASSINLDEFLVRAAEARKAEMEHFNQRVAAKLEKLEASAGGTDASEPVSELESIKAELRKSHARLNEAWRTLPPAGASRGARTWRVETTGHFYLENTEPRPLTLSERAAARARFEQTKAALKSFAAQNFAPRASRSVEMRRRQASEPPDSDAARKELEAVKAHLPASHKALNLRSADESNSTKQDRSLPAGSSDASRAHAAPGASGKPKSVTISDAVFVVEAPKATDESMDADADDAAADVEAEAEGVPANGDKKHKKDKKAKKEKRPPSLSKEERREMKRIKAELRESAVALAGAKVVLRPHRPQVSLVRVEDIFAPPAGRRPLTFTERAELRAIQADLQASAAEFDTKASLFAAIAHRAQAGCAGRGGSRPLRRSVELEAVKEEIRSWASALAGKTFQPRKILRSIDTMTAATPPPRELLRAKTVASALGSLSNVPPRMALASGGAAVAATLQVVPEVSSLSEGSHASTRARVRLHLRAHPARAAAVERMGLTALEREELEALKAELRASAVALAENLKRKKGGGEVIFAAKDAARQQAKLELKVQRQAEREAKKEAERERRRALKVHMKEKTGQRKAAGRIEDGDDGAPGVDASRRGKRGAKTDFEQIKAELREAAAALEVATAVLGKRIVRDEEVEAEILPPGASLIHPTLSDEERAAAREDMEQVKAELRASAVELSARDGQSKSSAAQSSEGAPPELEAARTAAKMAVNRLAAGLKLTDADKAAVTALVALLAQVEAGGVSTGARSMTDQIARRWVEREEIQALQEKARRGEALDVDEVDRMLAEQERRTRQREAAASKGGGAAEERLQEHARRKLSMTAPAPRRGNAGRPKLARKIASGENEAPMGAGGPMGSVPAGVGAMCATDMPSGRSLSPRRGSAPAAVDGLSTDMPQEAKKLTMADLQAAVARSGGSHGNIDAFIKAMDSEDEDEEGRPCGPSGAQDGEPPQHQSTEAAGASAQHAKVPSSWQHSALLIKAALNPIDDEVMRAAIKVQRPPGGSPRRKERYRAFEDSLVPVMEADAEEVEGRATEAEWLAMRSRTAARALTEVARWLGLQPNAADKLTEMAQRNADIKSENQASALPSTPQAQSAEQTQSPVAQAPAPRSSRSLEGSWKELASDSLEAPVGSRSSSGATGPRRDAGEHVNVMCEAHTQTDSADQWPRRESAGALEQGRPQSGSAEIESANAPELAAQRRLLVEAAEAAAERRRLDEAVEVARERQQLADERRQHAAEERERLEQAAARLERERERLAAARDEKLAEEAAHREARLVEEAEAREARLVEQAARRAEEARLREAEAGRLLEREAQRSSERQAELARLAAVEARQEEEARAREAAAREWEAERRAREEERIRLQGENETLRHAIAKRQLEEENEVLRRELQEAKEAGQEAIAELARQLASSPEPARAIAAVAGSPGVGDRASSGLLPSIGGFGTSPGPSGNGWDTEFPEARPQIVHPGARRSNHAALLRAALATTEPPRPSYPAILHAEPAWRVGPGKMRSMPQPEYGMAGVGLSTNPHVNSRGSYGAYETYTESRPAWTHVYGSPAAERPAAPRSARSARPARLSASQPLPARQSSASAMRPHPVRDAGYRQGSFPMAQTHPLLAAHNGSSLFLLDDSRGGKLVPLSPYRAPEFDGAADAFEANSPTPALRGEMTALRSFAATPPASPREGGAARPSPSPRSRRGLPAAGELNPAKSRSSLLRTYGVV
jgi:hypothetical protein